LDIYLFEIIQKCKGNGIGKITFLKNTASVAETAGDGQGTLLTY